MSSRPSLRASFWVVAALAGATAVLGARLQNQPPPNPQQPTFRADANYVRVDAYPTVNGVPVTDLTRDDFEVFEDNAPQRLDAFEHVLIRGGTPLNVAREPNTVAESRAMLDNPRARVFVVFLDIGHVDVDSSHDIRQPLVNALNRLIGPEDLVGVMTPQMSAADVTFARRTTTIEGMLARYWDWGQRGRINSNDPHESAYQQCYPGVPTRCGDDRGIADAMIVRRREKLTLDALDELVDYLQTAREERKAVLTVTNGWPLFRPDSSLSRNVNDCQPAAPPIGIDPRTGRLSTQPREDPASPNPRQCDVDRMALAQLDDYNAFHMMLDHANRANVTFYPIDPRGLAVFDTPIDYQRTGLPPPGQPILPGPIQDSAMLQSRLSSLRDLAAATDGIAVINTNDLERGLRRVTDDLSSYYLLGYYSTGKLDGRFHSIRVRVKRPGVDVRARRGFLAATAADVERAKAPQVTATSASSVTATAAALVAPALATLSSVARDTRLRVFLLAGHKANGTPAIWAVGELGSGTEWKNGAEVDVAVRSESDSWGATAGQRVAAGSRSFRIELAPAPAASGDSNVRIRVSPLDRSAEPATDLQRMSLPASGTSVGALVNRRGPATANREVPTADLRFRRNEQIRIELPDLSSEQPSARLLDRSGNPMSIPVTATARMDTDGTRWIGAQLALAPLAVGDYVIELTSGVGGAAVVAFRVVP